MLVLVEPVAGALSHLWVQRWAPELDCRSRAARLTCGAESDHGTGGGEDGETGSDVSGSEAGVDSGEQWCV